MTEIKMELYVAARGWNHPSWTGNYYPDDLPDDWRLSYYSNEFRAVAVPASEWTTIDPVEIERWVDDTHEEFMFFLEVEDPLTDWQHVMDSTRYMGDQLGGFLLCPEEVDEDLAIISASLGSAAEIAPVGLVLPPGVELSEAGKSLLIELTIEPCWNVGLGKPGWSELQLDSQMAIARVTENKSFTARDWREIIEICLGYGEIYHQTDIRRMLLLIDNNDPKINDLRTATMIGEMLTMVAK